MIPKFRVWFSEASQMITDDLESINLFDETVTITSGYYDNFDDDCIFGSIEVDIGNAILMQSTGLKDLNGVEIYEGDYLSLIDFEVGREYKGEVVFSRGSFCVAIQIKGRDVEVALYVTTEVDSLLEVLGNIYEHNHLLG